MPERQPGHPDDALELRRKAEQRAAEQLREHELPPLERLPDLVHELQVHQIELEMQNESLRQTHAELETSQSRYADLYDFAPVGYLTLDEQGRILEINLTACEMLNRTRSRVLGHPLVAYVNRSGKNRFLQYLQQCRDEIEGKTLTATANLDRGQDEVLPVRLHTTAGRHAVTGRREYRAVAVDISELQESEARLRLALEGGRMGLWDWDLTADQVVWDAREFQLLGLPPQHGPLAAAEFFDHVKADDLPALRQTIADVLEDGTEFHHEFRVLRADGQVRWLCVAGRVHRYKNGKPVRMIGVNFDVTKRKHAEAELQALNERLEQRVAERTSALEMLRDITAMANHAQDVEQALDYCLRRVVEHNGWRFGHAYLPAADDPDLLLPAYASYTAEAEPFRALREVTLRTPLRRGEGLPGAVFANGLPAWSTDIRPELGARRIGLAEDPGRAMTAAFPIKVGDRVVGVLEFFSDRPNVPDEGMLESMASVGIQLGRVIERKVFQDRLLTLAENEHRRIGQELHDDVGQELTGLALKIETLREILEEVPAAPGQDLARDLVVSLSRIREKIRVLSRGLVPTELEVPALEAALEELARQTSWGKKISCRFISQGETRVSNRETATQLYRIAQEAVCNAVRHSQGKHIEITLTSDETATVLEIRDDGRGLPPPEKRETGIGLQIMAYRTSLFGGKLTCESPPTGGTRVACRLNKTNP